VADVVGDVLFKRGRWSSGCGLTAGVSMPGRRQYRLRVTSSTAHRDNPIGGSK